MSELNKNELEVLRILWEEEELKPGQIEEKFSWEIENATLRSVLKGLMDNNLVERNKKGKAFFYKAKASQKSIMKKMFVKMADVFSGGSSTELIANLIKSEKLSKKEIEELKKIAFGK